MSATKHIFSHCIATDFHKNFHRTVYVKTVTFVFTITYMRHKGVSLRRG
jgi:hypothetical protein